MPPQTLFALLKQRIWRRRKRLPLASAGVVLGLAVTSLALAQSAALEQQPSAADASAAAPVATKGNSLWERDKLLGDLGGVRSVLVAKGIALNALETSEVLGNVTGGIRQGAIYEGATLMTLAVDPRKLFGLANGAFYVSAYQIRGRGLTTTDVGNLNIMSSIESPASTRLFELRYEQSFLDGKASVRIG